LAAEIDRATHREAGRAGVLVPLQPRGHNPPLVLIHNVWGGLLRYRLLAGYLGPDHPVYGFEASSLDGGTVPIRTLEEIADDYVRELKELQPEGPYYLCGYCAAGALTLEIAQRLHAAGGPVKLVAIIDGACPRPTALVDRVARNLGRIRMLRPRDVAGFLGRRLTNLALDLAYRLSLRLRRPLLTAFQGHHGVLSHATRHYRPGRYPGRITLIRSMQERRAARDPFLGWDAVAAGGVELRWVPGDHFTIMQEPLVGQLAAELRSCLNQTHAPVAGEPG
jgi:aspartate racemase